MRFRRNALSGLLGAGLVLAACSSQASSPPAEGGTSAPQEPATLEPGGAAANAGAEDVPIMEGAIDLKVTGNGSYFSYEIPSTLESVKSFYQEQLDATGWEKLSRSETGFADSVTLLRAKPDRNLSVTIQTIPNSENVRVLITLINN